MKPVLPPESRSLNDEQWHRLQLAYDVLCDPKTDDAEARTGAQFHVGQIIRDLNRDA